MSDRKEYMKQWHKDNPEKMAANIKRWRDKNPKKAIESSRRWKERNKQWYINYNKGLVLYRKIYYQIHKSDINERERNRRRTDLKYNLNDRMTSSIRMALRGNKKGRKWEDLVGYTLNDLISRLKVTMPEGYTWEDVLGGKLHIDHIVPISAFNFTKPEHADFKHCWALDNLQLLPARENILKSNKLFKPFQPALQISFR